MPFPTDDRAWNDTLLYLLERRRPGERTLAPEPFTDELPFVRTYDQPKMEDEPPFAWLVVHKGMVDQIDRAMLAELHGWAAPVFANEVFVVFARDKDLVAADLSDSVHVLSFYDQLKAAGLKVPGGEAPAVAPEPAAPAEPAPAQPAPAQPAPAQPAPPPPPAPVSAPQPAPARPAPAAPAALPSIRQQEVLAVLAEYLGDVTGRRVVDLACGLGRFDDLLAGAEVLGIDAAPDLIEDARQAHAASPNFRFVAADPRRPGLSERPFDIALLVDALHRPDADAAALLETAAAMTAPGGLLAVVVENREALDRRMGGGTEGQGFTLAELTGAVRAAGFRPVRADGAMLPWPGAAGGEAAVQTLRELGRLAGPAYAQTILLLARRG